VVRVVNRIPQPDINWVNNGSPVSSSSAPYKIYNIGNNAPVQLINFISAIENALGIKAVKQLLPIQPGDVPLTFADVSELVKDTGYKPNTPFQQGVINFVNWYKQYHNLS
jgi:UDP-glucuronate 4-epimerase